MQMLPIADVEKIVQLVANAADPTVHLSIPDRKRTLMNSLAAMIDADVWLWSSAVTNPDVPGDAAATNLLEGGWESDRQRQLAYEALTDTTLTRKMFAPMMEAATGGEFVTFMRHDVISDEEWPDASADWRKTGLEEFLMSLYPVSGNSFSGIGLHRKIGKPCYTERDRSVVHVVFSHVEWLHRHGSNPPMSGHVINLSPRERQVLMYLLAGLSKKQIASRLVISEHTVGDYMKSLHKHFSVSSRAELQAKFHSGATLALDDD